MMNNMDTGKTCTRKSVSYRLKHDKYDFHSSLFPSMLIEDLHSAIMPFRGGLKHPKFSIELIPSSKEVEKLITVGLPTEYGRSWNMTDAVCHFIDEAANYLAYYGKAYYEIVYNYSDGSKKEIESFTVEDIPYYCIRNTFGFYWQLLPLEFLKYRKTNMKMFIWLPKENIVFLSMPKELGGIKKYKGLLKQLKWLSDCNIPEFVMDDMAIQKQQKGYEFSIYENSHDIYLANITKNMGWTARGLFNKHSLEYYFFYRHLMFDKTRAILREYILRNLNDILKKTGKKMNFEAKIKINGIPSSQDYDNYIKQLMEGSLKFSEVVKLSSVL